MRRSDSSHALPPLGEQQSEGQIVAGVLEGDARSLGAVAGQEVERLELDAGRLGQRLLEDRLNLRDHARHRLVEAGRAMAGAERAAAVVLEPGAVDVALQMALAVEKQEEIERDRAVSVASCQ